MLTGFQTRGNAVLVSPSCRRRAIRVVILLAGLLALGLGDLYATVVHAASVGMNEANPIGHYLISSQSVTGLILFKLGSMGIAIGLLLRVREHRTTELASWMLLGVMVLLIMHWTDYNQQIAEEMSRSSFQALAANMSSSFTDTAFP
ncbi:MAG: hypothetical protein OER86_08110 [Phycisphaerae bacterium]|nr:hypothetical protein [Phycisphaerae bacterium]